MKNLFFATALMAALGVQAQSIQVIKESDNGATLQQRDNGEIVAIALPVQAGQSKWELASYNEDVLAFAAVNTEQPSASGNALQYFRFKSTGATGKCPIKLNRKGGDKGQKSFEVTYEVVRPGPVLALAQVLSKHDGLTFTFSKAEAAKAKLFRISLNNSGGEWKVKSATDKLVKATAVPKAGPFAEAGQQDLWFSLAGGAGIGHVRLSRTVGGQTENFTVYIVVK